MNWTKSAKKSPIKCEDDDYISLAIAFANCLSQLNGVARVLVSSIDPSEKNEETI